MGSRPMRALQGTAVHTLSTVGSPLSRHLPWLARPRLTDQKLAFSTCPPPEQDVTLHDLDAANARPQGGQDILSMMGQVGAGRLFDPAVSFGHRP